jgi:hypothetical protein
VSCNADLDLGEKRQEVVGEESRVDNMPCCGGNQNLYRQQTWGDISKGDGKGWKREVGKGRGPEGPCCSLILIFIWDLIKLSSMTLSFFREPSMPFDSIPTNKRSITPEKSERRVVSSAYQSYSTIHKFSRQETSHLLSSLATTLRSAGGTNNAGK